MALLRLQGNTANPVTHVDLKDVSPPAGKVCDLGPDDPPLPLKDELDVPVWVGIEVEDVGLEDINITGTLAWGGCGENSDPTEDCTNVCVHTFTEADPGDMREKKGTWGFWVHHTTHRVEHFRAGSESLQ
jgi:hypothetical protein